MSKASDFIGGVLGVVLIMGAVNYFINGSNNNETSNNTSNSIITSNASDKDVSTNSVDESEEKKYFTAIGIVYPSSILLQDEYSTATFYVDGDKIGTLSEGEKRTFVMYLTEGDHRLTVSRVITDYDSITFNVHNDVDYGIFVENYVGIKYAYSLNGTTLSFIDMPSCSDDEYIYTDSWLEYAKTHEDVYYF